MCQIRPNILHRSSFNEFVLRKRCSHEYAIAGVSFCMLMLVKGVLCNSFEGRT